MRQTRDGGVELLEYSQGGGPPVRSAPVMRSRGQLSLDPLLRWSRGIPLPEGQFPPGTSPNAVLGRELDCGT